MKSNLLKKLLVVVLLLTLVVGVLAACGDKNPPDDDKTGGDKTGGDSTQPCKTHKVGKNGTKATCQNKAVCGKCGEEFGDLAPHNYKNGKCEVCGAEKPKADAELFFDGLWESARSIGTEKVKTDENLGIKLAGSVEVTLGDATLPVVFDVQLFVDRKDNGATSAAKVVLSVSELKLEAIYFLNDAENVYIKAAATSEWDSAKMQVVPFELMQKDMATTWNSTYAGVVDGFIEKPLLNNMSIIDIVGALVKGFGPDFNLNSTVNGLLGSLGLDLSALAENETVAKVLDALGITIGADGIDIKAVLMAVQNLAADNQNPNGLTVVTNKGQVGKAAYSGQVNIISGGVAGLINMVLPGLVNSIPELNGAIEHGIEAWLGYESSAQNEIEKFWIEAIVKGDAEDAKGLDKDLKVKIVLDDLIIENVATPSFKSEVTGAQPLTAAFKAELDMPANYIGFAKTVTDIAKAYTDVDLANVKVGGKIAIEGHFDVVSLALDGHLKGEIVVKVDDGKSFLKVELFPAEGLETANPMTTGRITLKVGGEIGEFAKAAFTALLNKFSVNVDGFLANVFPTAQEGISASIVAILAGEGPEYVFEAQSAGIYGNLSEFLSGLLNKEPEINPEEPQTDAGATAGETREAYVNVVALLNLILKEEMIKNEGEYGLVINIKNPGRILDSKYIAQSVLDQIDNVSNGWYETDEVKTIVAEDGTETTETIRTRVEEKNMKLDGLTKDASLNYVDDKGAVVYFYCWGLNDFLSADCGLGKVCNGKLSTMLNTLGEVEISITAKGLCIKVDDGKGGKVKLVANFRLGTTDVAAVPTK